MPLPYIAILKNGVRIALRPRRGEWFTFYENLIRKDYLQHGICLREGDTVIDIGANIGAFTILAAVSVGPSGRVFAFEPHPAICERLKKNVRLNGLSNVVVFNQAVGGGDGHAELATFRKSAFNTLIDVDVVDGRKTRRDRGVSVQVRSINSLLDNMNLTSVDLLKVDSEGSEYGIFDRLTPRHARRIRQISMEVHEVPGPSPNEITTRLAALGFRVQETSPLTAFLAREANAVIGVGT